MVELYAAWHGIHLVGGALRAGVAFATSAELHTPPDTPRKSLVFEKGGRVVMEPRSEGA